MKLRLTSADDLLHVDLQGYGKKIKIEKNEKEFFSYQDKYKKRKNYTI